jgi:surface protein
MFQSAYYFNQDISNWSTSNVTSMASMFLGALPALKTTFNSGQIAGSSSKQLNWSAPRCTSFSAMFQNNAGFNQPIPTLVDVSCNILNNMFVGASVFNQNVSAWKTDNVTTMSAMFSGASAFNNGETGIQDINGNPLIATYTNATAILSLPDASFNSQLTTNDVLIITTPAIIYTSKIQRIISDTSLVLLTPFTANILSGITSITKQVAGTADLSWNTQNVTTTTSMFQSAYYFNQRLPWNMRVNRTVSSMFAGTTTTFITLFNNGEILTGTTQPLTSGVVPTWDFNGGTITGSGTLWHTNCRLTNANGQTVNPQIYA